MDVEEFQPRLNRGSSANASVRTGTSKLSLRHHNDKLSLNLRGNRNAFNESQRLDDESLERPVRHNDRTFLNNVRNTQSQRPVSPDSGWLEKPKQRFQVKRNVFPLNLPGPQQQEAKNVAVESENTSSSSYKENVVKDQDQIQAKKTLKSATVSRNASSSREPPEVPNGPVDSRVSLQSHAEQSPRKAVTPSPHKSNSRRGNSSTLASLPFESKGFCPICQVPFSCLGVQPSVHSNSCLEPSDGPECSAGKDCKSTSYHHYRDFRHDILAEERACAGVDASELDPEIEEKLLNDSDEDPSNKRKHVEDDLPSPKRVKSVQEEDEQSSQSSNDSNPFLQPTELGLDETNEAQHNTYSPELFPDLDADQDAQHEEIQEEVEKEDSVKTAEVPHQEGSSIPCVAGVCDKKQLGVEITVQTPNGKEMTVQAVAGPSGWQKVEGATEDDGVKVGQCQCSHNLQVHCKVPSHSAAVASTSAAVASTSAPVPRPGPSNKELWAPLMKRLTSGSISVLSDESSSSSLESSHNGVLSKRKCPFSKLIPGTKFAVDAFNYGDIPGVKFYFLSHFHYDHYIGLTAKWKNTIFCSAVTARLMRLQFKVRPDLIQILEVDQPRTVDKVMVTALDANHCPGSLMLLFQLTDGRTYLHTGDFRASQHMESYSVFWNHIDVDALYLDTTYCNAKYDFPTQDEVLQCVVEQVDKHTSQQNSRVLFLCGSYTIGKEKVFKAVAEHIGSKIWSRPKKLKILTELRDPKITSLLTSNAKEAAVHVVSMQEINLQSLQRYLQSVRFHFSEVVAFRPSGWQYSQRNKLMYSLETREKVTIYSLPYSEHSSFLELQRFVKFLKPRKVVATVKPKDQSWEQVACICNTWARVAREIQPEPGLR